MASNRDWGVASQSITLPPFAPPNTPRIVIGPTVPPLLQAMYGGDITSTIIWYPGFDDTTFHYYATTNIGEVVRGNFDSGVGLQFDSYVGTIWTVNSESFDVFSDFISLNAAEEATLGPDLMTFRSAVDLNTAIGGTTASATYANMPGPPQDDIEKIYSDTRVQALILASAWCNGAVPTTVELAVNAGGSDSLCGRLVFNTASQHHLIGGLIDISGLSDGTQTMTARWRRSAGTGTITIDGGDFAAIYLRETPPPPP